jgi:hypothetical protein
VASNHRDKNISLGNKTESTSALGHACCGETTYGLKAPKFGAGRLVNLRLRVKQSTQYALHPEMLAGVN